MSGLTLVLGGVRSGKSRFAEDLAAATGLEKIYIATAEAFDDGLKARIAAHQARRGDDWTTFDVPVDLPETLSAQSSSDKVVLVECLTLWLTNLLVKEIEPDDAIHDLLVAVKARRGPVILVSNEVGLGVMPMNSLARRFADLAGSLHQDLAACADKVVLVAAGLPMTLKPVKE